MRKIIYSLLTLPTIASVGTAFAAFPDVPSSHTDAKAIEYLENHDIFQGKPDVNGVLNFDPSAPLNRAELVTILIRALDVNIDIGTKSCFRDVKSDAWYFTSVCTAERMGIVSGYPDGAFRPAQTINKAEALKVITNALGFWSELEMYESFIEDPKNSERFTVYLIMAKEWNLLDESRTAKYPDSLMTRADIAQLLYRSIITGMERLTGDLPVFSETLAAKYASTPIDLYGTTEADIFEKLYENGKEYKNERLGFSLLLPKTMPTYMCSNQKPAIVDVTTIEKEDNVYFGPSWFEDQKYLGSNPDGSGKYGECERYEMTAADDEYFTRIIRTRIVKNDSEISSFIKDYFGETCGPFERKPSTQYDIEDIEVIPVPFPGVENPDDLGDYSCITNYRYVMKYNPATHRIFMINLGQDGFIYLPQEDGTFGQALDVIIMKTLRMF